MNKKFLFMLVMATLGLRLFCQDEEQLTVQRYEQYKEDAIRKWTKLQEQKIVVFDENGKRSYRCFVIACLSALMTAYTAEKTAAWYWYYHGLNPVSALTNITALLLIMRELTCMAIDAQRINKRTADQEDLENYIQSIDQYLMAVKKKPKDGSARKPASQPQE